MSSPVERNQTLAARDGVERHEPPAPGILGGPEVHTLVTAEELAQTFEDAGPEVRLTDYAFEDWLAFALFWAMSLAVFL